MQFHLDVFIKENSVEYETRFQLEEANSHIESLKAITELAVKGLKEIKDRYGFFENKSDSMYSVAHNALLEIERLQNGTT